jgi:hypothetical protein
MQRVPKLDSRWKAAAPSSWLSRQYSGNKRKRASTDLACSACLGTSGGTGDWWASIPREQSWAPTPCSSYTGLGFSSIPPRHCSIPHSPGYGGAGARDEPCSVAIVFLTPGQSPRRLHSRARFAPHDDGRPFMVSFEKLLRRFHVELHPLARGEQAPSPKDRMIFQGLALRRQLDSLAASRCPCWPAARCGSIGASVLSRGDI